MQDQVSWDPSTRVSFPKSAAAHVHFEHDGVRFARVTDERLFGSGEAVAHFVQDNVLGDWHRVSAEDFEMVVARCKAQPRSRLAAEPGPHRVTFRFGPPDSTFERLVQACDDDAVTEVVVKRLWFVAEDARAA